MDNATHLLTSLGVAALGQNIPALLEEDTRKRKAALKQRGCPFY